MRNGGDLLRVRCAGRDWSGQALEIVEGKAITLDAFRIVGIMDISGIVIGILLLGHAGYCWKHQGTHGRTPKNGKVWRS
ncbi:MAG: hypothetical protein CMO80_10035 [Verrucomicrobiales bacterium]|nr:hypothetical protein [Verrucomicrobiales bacterium]